MKNTILALLLISSAAFAGKKDPQEDFNSYARSLDRDLTSLISHVAKCASNEAESRAQLEGIMFAVRNIQISMECQFEETSKCTPQLQDLSRTQEAVNDLNVKVNGTVFQMLVSTYRDNGCGEDVKTLNKVARKIRAYTVEFNKLKAKKPAVPAVPTEPASPAPVPAIRGS